MLLLVCRNTGRSAVRELPERSPGMFHRNRSTIALEPSPDGSQAFNLISLLPAKASILICHNPETIKYSDSLLLYRKPTLYGTPTKLEHETVSHESNAQGMYSQRPSNDDTVIKNKKRITL